MLQALANGLVVAGRGVAPTLARADLHQWHLRPAGAAHLGPGARPIRGAAGAERIARVLGLREVDTVRVQQGRLW